MLAERIARFVDAALAGGRSEPFGTLALDVHRWQVAGTRCSPRCVDGPRPLDRDPRGPGRPVPPSSRGVRTAGDFRSPRQTGPRGRWCSGPRATTSGRRGEHHLRSTALYDRGADRWARRCVPGIPPDRPRCSRTPRSPRTRRCPTWSRRSGRRTGHLARSRGLVDADGFARRRAARAAAVRRRRPGSRWPIGSTGDRPRSRRLGADGHRRVQGAPGRAGRAARSGPRARGAAAGAVGDRVRDDRAVVAALGNAGAALPRPAVAARWSRSIRRAAARSPRGNGASCGSTTCATSTARSRSRPWTRGGYRRRQHRVGWPVTWAEARGCSLTVEEAWAPG